MRAPIPFIRNPVSDVRVVESDSDGAARIIISAYSVVNGFTEAVLERAGEPAFAAALDIAADQGALDRLSPELALALWASGLIVLPAEVAHGFAPARFAAASGDFARDGFALLTDCLTPAIVDILARHYRAAIENGAVGMSDGQVDRWQLHNDPAGRVVQRALLPAVAALVGVPVKPSYCYASLYRQGAVLPVHTDRLQCEYTLSVLIDHHPAPTNGVSPWAIQIYPHPDAEPIDCFQSLGGGILFRGRDLPHGRKQLPADETCWTLLLHYVNADFAGALD
ncbi:hypothetical protein [Sphingomonas sp.]|uniref:hypothetical protein n=1 Tax=Sphingomonas sp. TaxID=28214 RepID=UPI002E1228FC|nr:hypothetical protein [Sphingomonas sp.]